MEYLLQSELLHADARVYCVDADFVQVVSEAVNAACRIGLKGFDTEKTPPIYNHAEQ
jgi:hypothetical protein